MNGKNVSLKEVLEFRERKASDRSLLEEVYTMPKPGLVDLYSCGAHSDMDVHIFEKSAKALKPYFICMAAQGYRMNCSPEELFGEKITGALGITKRFVGTEPSCKVTAFYNDEVKNLNSPRGVFKTPRGEFKNIKIELFELQCFHTHFFQQF